MMGICWIFGLFCLVFMTEYDSLVWPGTHYVIQAGLESTAILPQFNPGFYALDSA